METTPEHTPHHRHHRSGWRLVGLFALVFGACIAAMLALGLVVVMLLGEEVLGGRTAAETWSPALGCNVVGIAVRGPITISPGECVDEFCSVVTSSDEVIEYLREAKENDSIKAILLDIESPGGSPVPSEEIALAVRNAEKPSVAWVRQMAASGAYWVAAGANTIVASPNSDVGSIGVSMSYLDASGYNAEEGLTFNSLSSGKFKDTGSPNKALTDEEMMLLQRDIEITHENFVASVASLRDLAVEQVAALADGSTMLGAMALENGLIDRLGGQQEAYAALEEAIGEEPVICWGGL